MLRSYGEMTTHPKKRLVFVLTGLGLKAGVMAGLLMIAFPVYAAEKAVPAELDPTTDQVLFQEIPTVIGASKYEQRTTEAPSYVSIVTAEEIKRYGYRTLAEIVSSVAGFYPNYDRSYNYVGLRGFSLPGDYNTRVLVLLNGHRLNENIYDSTGFGTDGIINGSKRVFKGE